jgi:hypothetical protein
LAAERIRLLEGSSIGDGDFAPMIVVQMGETSNDTIDSDQRAGYADGEITEIVARVALNIFTNHFNPVAQTEVDFPRVPAALVQTA